MGEINTWITHVMIIVLISFWGFIILRRLDDLKIKTDVIFQAIKKRELGGILEEGISENTSDNIEGRYRINKNKENSNTEYEIVTPQFELVSQKKGAEISSELIPDFKSDIKNEMKNIYKRTSISSEQNFKVLYFDSIVRGNVSDKVNLMLEYNLHMKNPDNAFCDFTLAGWKVKGT